MSSDHPVDTDRMVFASPKKRYSVERQMPCAWDMLLVKLKTCVVPSLSQAIPGAFPDEYIHLVSSCINKRSMTLPRNDESSIAKDPSFFHILWQDRRNSKLTEDSAAEGCRPCKGENIIGSTLEEKHAKDLKLEHTCASDVVRSLCTFMYNEEYRKVMDVKREKDEEHLDKAFLLSSQTAASFYETKTMEDLVFPFVFPFCYWNPLAKHSVASKWKIKHFPYYVLLCARINFVIHLLRLVSETIYLSQDHIKDKDYKRKLKDSSSLYKSVFKNADYVGDNSELDKILHFDLQSELVRPSNSVRYTFSSVKERLQSLLQCHLSLMQSIEILCSRNKVATLALLIDRPSLIDFLVKPLKYVYYADDAPYIKKFVTEHNEPSNLEEVRANSEKVIKIVESTKEHERYSIFRHDASDKELRKSFAEINTDLLLFERNISLHMYKKSLEEKSEEEIKNKERACLSGSLYYRHPSLAYDEKFVVSVTVNKATKKTSKRKNAKRTKTSDAPTSVSQASVMDVSSIAKGVFSDTCTVHKRRMFEEISRDERLCSFFVLLTRPQMIHCEFEECIDKMADILEEYSENERDQMNLLMYACAHFVPLSASRRENSDESELSREDSEEESDQEGDYCPVSIDRASFERSAKRSLPRAHPVMNVLNHGTKKEKRDLVKKLALVPDSKKRRFSWKESLVYYAILLRINLCIEMIELCTMHLEMERRIRQFHDRHIEERKQLEKQCPSQNPDKDSNPTPSPSAYRWDWVSEETHQRDDLVYNLGQLKFSAHTILMDHIPLLTNMLDSGMFKDNSVVNAYGGAYYEALRPIPDSFPTWRDMPDISHVFPFIDFVTTAKKKGSDLLYILTKLFENRCQIRKMADMVSALYQQDKGMKCLLDNVIECSMFGLYPHANHRDIVKDVGLIVKFYRNMHVAPAVHKKNKENSLRMRTPPEKYREQLFYRVCHDQKTLRGLLREFFCHSVETTGGGLDRCLDEIIWFGKPYVKWTEFKKSAYYNCDLFREYLFSTQRFPGPRKDGTKITYGKTAVEDAEPLTISKRGRGRGRGRGRSKIRITKRVQKPKKRIKMLRLDVSWRNFLLEKKSRITLEEERLWRYYMLCQRSVYSSNTGRVINRKDNEVLYYSIFSCSETRVYAYDPGAYIDSLFSNSNTGREVVHSVPVILHNAIRKSLESVSPDRRDSLNNRSILKLLSDVRVEGSGNAGVASWKTELLERVSSELTSFDSVFSKGVTADIDKVVFALKGCTEISHLCTFHPSTLRNTDLLKAHFAKKKKESKKNKANEIAWRDNYKYTMYQKRYHELVKYEIVKNELSDDSGPVDRPPIHMQKRIQFYEGLGLFSYHTEKYFVQILKWLHENCEMDKESVRLLCEAMNAYCVRSTPNRISECISLMCSKDRVLFYYFLEEDQKKNYACTVRLSVRENIETLRSIQMRNFVYTNVCTVADPKDYIVPEVSQIYQSGYTTCCVRITSFYSEKGYGMYETVDSTPIPILINQNFSPYCVPFIKEDSANGTRYLKNKPEITCWHGNSKNARNRNRNQQKTLLSKTENRDFEVDDVVKRISVNAQSMLENNFVDGDAEDYSAIDEDIDYGYEDQDEEDRKGMDAEDDISHARHSREKSVSGSYERDTDHSDGVATPGRDEEDYEGEEGEDAPTLLGSVYQDSSHSKKNFSLSRLVNIDIGQDQSHDRKDTNEEAGLSPLSRRKTKSRRGKKRKHVHTNESKHVSAKEPTVSTTAAKGKQRQQSNDTSLCSVPGLNRVIMFTSFGRVVYTVNSLGDVMAFRHCPKCGSFTVYKHDLWGAGGYMCGKCSMNHIQRVQCVFDTNSGDFSVVNPLKSQYLFNESEEKGKKQGASQKSSDGANIKRRSASGWNPRLIVNEDSIRDEEENLDRNNSLNDISEEEREEYEEENTEESLDTRDKPKSLSEEDIFKEESGQEEIVYEKEEGIAPSSEIDQSALTSYTSGALSVLFGSVFNSRDRALDSLEEGDSDDDGYSTESSFVSSLSSESYDSKGSGDQKESAKKRAKTQNKKNSTTIHIEEEKYKIQNGNPNPNGARYSDKYHELYKKSKIMRSKIISHFFVRFYAFDDVSYGENRTVLRIERMSRKAYRENRYLMNPDSHTMCVFRQSKDIKFISMIRRFSKKRNSRWGYRPRKPRL